MRDQGISLLNIVGGEAYVVTENTAGIEGRQLSQVGLIWGDDQSFQAIRERNYRPVR